LVKAALTGLGTRLYKKNNVRTATTIHARTSFKSVWRELIEQPMINISVIEKSSP
jgi:hypothetical protein